MATYTSNYAWTKPSGSDPVDISVLNGNLDSQDGIIHDAFLNMAVPFSELSTYTVGNIVLYGTKTYKCRVPVTTPGAWTGATNWDEYKLSELTFDNTPTDGSNNPVKSDGIYDSEKDIYAVMGQMGAKNLIPFPYYEASGKNNRGVVFTYGSDGIVYMNGTSEQSSQPFIMLQSRLAQNPTSILEGHSYILYCDSDSPYALGQIFFYRKNDGSSVNLTFSYEYSDGVTGTVTQFYISLRHHDAICKWVKFTVTSGNASAPQIDLRVDQGSHQVNNAYGKVMLIDGRDTDLTWHIFAKTNKQLTDDVSSILTEQDSIETELDTKADKTATASGETLVLVPTSEGNALIHTAYGMSVQDGTPTPSSPIDIVSAKADFRCVGKNLIPYPYGFIPANIFSIENDGTVVMNGSTSNRINCWLVDHTGGDYWLPSGTYKIIVSEAPDNVKWAVGVNYYMNNTWVSAVSVATGKKSVNFTVDTSSSAYNIVSLCVTAFANSSFSNLKIKVMVVKDSVNDDTYEPYIKHDVTTDLTLRAIEVTSSDAYNLVRDGKYYIADTLDYTEDDGFVVTRRIGDTDLGNFDYQYLSGTQVFQTSITGIKNTAYNKAVAISEGFVYHTGQMSTMPNGGMRLNESGENYVNFKNTALTDPTAFKTAVNGIKIDYILATPTTENITTEQALALLGLKTYDESTTISSQAEPSCTIAVEYAKERLGALALTAYNTAKGNDLRITALEG